MNIKNIEFLKKNTECIPTNRGFYVQYLKTLKKWLYKFVNNINETTEIEVDDDIKEIGEKLIFTQIKSYTSCFNLNSAEIKNALYNFYILYLENLYINKNTIFVFHTNTGIKVKDTILKEWSKNNNLSNNQELKDKCIKKTKDIITKIVQDIFVNKKSNTYKNEYIYKDFLKELNSQNFEKFIINIRWEFLNINPEEEIKLIEDEIKVLLNSSIFLNKPKDLIFKYLLSEIYERSKEKNKSKRVLNNEILAKILSKTDKEIEKCINKKFINVIILNQKNILDFLKQIDYKTDKILNKVDKIPAIYKLLIEYIQPNNIKKNQKIINHLQNTKKLISSGQSISALTSLDELVKIFKEDTITVDEQAYNEKKIEENIFKTPYSSIDVLQQDNKEKKIDSEKINNTSVQIMSKEQRKLLGLISTSFLYYTIEFYEKILTQINFRKELNFFKKNKILKINKSNEIEISNNIRKIFLKNKDEKNELHKEWIKILYPFAHHCDLALILSFHYIAVKQFDLAIYTSSDIVNSLEPGNWNKYYKYFFEIIIKNKYIMNRIEPTSRINLYNSYALCLSRLNENDEAIKYFNKLRIYCLKKDKKWEIGQTYINLGVVYYHKKDFKKAKKLYEKAIDFAIKNNDKGLQGRALHNLAMIMVDDNNEYAEKLIHESIKLKKEVNDKLGITGSFLGIGNIYANRKNFDKALKYYKKAEKTSYKYDLRFERSYVLNNIGTVYIEMEDFDKALIYLKDAKIIAEKEGFVQVLILILKNLCFIKMKLDNFDDAILLYENLYKLYNNNPIEEIIILHDIAVAFYKKNNIKKARSFFNKAIKKGYQHKNYEWIYKCYIDKSLTYKTYKLKYNYLKKIALFEYENNKFLISGKIWEKIFEDLIKDNQDDKMIEESIKFGIICFEKNNNKIHLLDFYKLIYIWYSNYKKNYDQAIIILDKIKQLSQTLKLIKTKVTAIEEKGICYINKYNFKEAKKHHLKALQIARKYNLKEKIEISLNNLGELYRRSGKPKKSLEHFIEAEKLAIFRKDIKARLLVSHNLALSLFDAGNIGEANNKMIKLKQYSKNKNFIYEYVRAIHALANFAWMQGKIGLSEKRYDKALEESIKYNLSNLKIDIAINYSHFFTEIKEDNAKALKILLNIIVEAKYSPYLHLIYIKLAEIYETNQDLSNSKKYWIKAVDETKLKLSNDYIYCLKSLGEIYYKENNLLKGDIEFEKVLNFTINPAEKVNVLIEQINILLELNQEKNAEKIGKKAKKIVENHQLINEGIDLLICFGDHNWKENIYEALKTYFSALYFSISSKSSESLINEKFFKIGAYILSKILLIKRDIRIKEIDNTTKKLNIHYLNKMKTWKKELKIKKEYLSNFLWPLKLAKELTLITENDNEISGKLTIKKLEQIFPE